MDKLSLLTFDWHCSNIYYLDRLVQETIYGEDLRVVANFSGKEYKKDGEVISPKSLMIYDGADKMEYNYSKEYWNNKIWV